MREIYLNWVRENRCYFFIDTDLLTTEPYPLKIIIYVRICSNFQEKQETVLQI